MTLPQWSTTPANNANGVTGVNMATGAPPSTVHPGIRQIMADVAQWYATPTGYRNRIINGDMRIDQRNSGAAQTIVAAAAAAYTIDRFYATCTGANVTGQQIAGSNADQFVYQFTGAASVTGIAFGQRVEAINIWDLNGKTVTVSVELANSLLTTVNWTAYYPTAADNWAGRTQIATGSFTVNSTPTVYSAQISLPSNVTAGFEIEFSVGAQTSGTWKIGQVQVESGSIATPFERRLIGAELSLCHRYCYAIRSNSTVYIIGVGIGNTTTQIQCNVYLPTSMRIPPTAFTSSAASTFNSAGAATSIAMPYVTSNIALFALTVASATVAASVTCYFNSAAGFLIITAEL